MPTVSALPGHLLWSGPALSPVLGSLSVSGALLEVLVGGAEETAVSGALLEVLTGGAEQTSVSGALLEVLVGPDPSWLQVDGAVLEVLCGRLHPTRDAPVSNYQDLNEQRFGRDLVLPGPGKEVQPTLSGDWPTISGRPNLHAALLRRVLTTATQLVHRPDYGGGLETFVGTLGNLQERSRMAAGVQSNCYRDPRVEEVQVRVGDPEEDRVVLQLLVKPAGEVESETLSVVTGA